MLEIDLRFEGLDEAIKRLEQLEPIAREKAMQSAMKKAMRPVVNSAKSLAPRRSGALRLSIAAVALPAGKVNRRGVLAAGARDTFAYVTVAPVSKNRRAIALYNFHYGRKRPIRGIYYGHFVEFGTKRGQRPNAFLGQAMLANRQRVLDIFGKEIGRAIERQLRRK